MLNDNYTLTTEDIAAFTGTANKVMLPSNTLLFRMITGNKNHLMANWWFQANEIERMIERSMKTSDLVGFVRSRFAVKETWNPRMNYLLVIRLTSNIWGWTGKTRFQHSSEYSNMTFIGGGQQVYVPNLSDKGDQVNSQYAAIVRYQDVGALFFGKGKEAFSKGIK